MADKKPFEEHLKLIQRRSEELRRKDIEFSRGFKDNLSEMRRRCDDEMQQNRRELQASIRDFNKRMEERDADRTGRMRNDNGSFKDTRAIMDTRVRSMPVLCGEPPARESSDRTLRREKIGGVIKASTNEYFAEMRSVKDKLSERSNTMSFGKKGRPQDVVFEERKVAGLNLLSQGAREYGMKMEAIYEKHTERNLKERMKHKADFQSHLDHRLSVLDENTARRQAAEQKKKEEALERDERLRDRGKTFGGYQPSVKSVRRQQIEAAHATLRTEG